jgi:hypothetical protein
MATNSKPNHTLPTNCNVAARCLILPSAARIASGTGVNDGTGTTVSAGTWPGVDGYTSADVFLTCTARSGTSPTLNVYIQKLSPDGSTWQDVASCTQLTNTGNQSFTTISASTVPFTPTDATLTQTTMKLAQMGNTWRVKWVIGGTNPSFTFAVWGDFYK